MNLLIQRSATKRTVHAIIIIIVLLALVACGGGNDTSTTAPAETSAAAPASPNTAGPATAAPTLTAPPAPPDTVAASATPAEVAAAPVSDARQIIAAAMNKWYSSGPFQMHITSSLPDSPPTDVWVVPPDRSRYQQTMEDGSLIEGITIGTTSYSFVDGEWQTAETEGVSFAEPFWSDPAALSDLQDIQALGEQTINGVAASGYSFTDISLPDALTTLWIGPNGAPVQMIGVTADETVTYAFSYDASITITAPQ